MKRASIAALVVGVVSLSSQAHADDAAFKKTSVHLSAPADTAVVGGALLGALALAQYPVEPSHWRSELLPIDVPERASLSLTDAVVSNVTIIASGAVPLLAEGLKADAQSPAKLVIYGETLALGLLFNSAGKYLVQRPRPYTYKRGINGKLYVQEEGRDAYLSFYSGHATATFAAAVSGSMLFAYGESNANLRALVWGTEMALASSTAVLRVRAGKHYPSDVLFGAAVGIGLGILVPRAHVAPGERGFYSPSGVEWAAIGGGVLVGTAVPALLPRHRDRATPAPPPLSVRAILPTVSTTGAGVVLTGTIY